MGWLDEGSPYTRIQRPQSATLGRFVEAFNAGGSDYNGSEGAVGNLPNASVHVSPERHDIQ